MALDPNQSTSWGLGPLGGALGTPSTSTAPLAPPQMFSPEQIAQMRQHAMALQEPPKEGIHHWTQGLAEMVRAIQGNREADFARQSEAAGRQQGAAAIGQIYAPYLSSGGVSPPASGAAPAVSSGNDAAGAIPSSSDQPPVPSLPASTATTADASAPRGVRNNNPLNIEDGDFAQSQPGYAGSDGRFAKFAAPEHGVAAADALLNTYQTKHGLNTVAGIVGRWAPSSDGNDTKAYAAHVASQLGIGPNDPVPPEMRQQLIAAMAQHENGRPLAAAPTGLLAPIQPPAATASPTVSPAAPLSYARSDDNPGLPKEITRGASSPRPSVFNTGAPPDPMAGLATSSLMSPGTLSPDLGRYGSMVNAIAGRPIPAGGIAPPGGLPWNPDDFKRQVAAMEAAKGPTTMPGVPPPSGGWSPDEFKRQVALIEGAKGGPVADAATSPAVPDDGASPPLTPQEQAMMDLVKPGTHGYPPLNPAEQQMMAMVGGGATPPAPSPPAAPADVPPTPTAASPVPLPQARPAIPSFLLPGSAIPGAVGPTSVGGLPLVPPGTTPSSPPLALPPPFGPVSVNGQPLPQSGRPPASGNLAPMVDAIAGRPVPPSAAPSAGGGAAIPVSSTTVAQAGAPTSIAPAAPRGSSGLPQPLTSPVGQITQDQLTRTLANPWVPESAKAAMLQMIQQRAQPQTMDVEGGKLMFDAAGRKVFLPEPKFGTVKIGSAEVPTVSHFDPDTKQWTTTTLAPGGGVQTTGNPGGGSLPHPAQAQGAPVEPDLSTIGGIQANEAAQAGAKKSAEESATTGAKYYDSLHKGLAGSAMIAAQQKQNIDMLRQVAASPNFTPGAGSETALGLQRIAAQLGINPEGAAPREIFNQVATRILSDQISGIKSMASETGETGGRIFKSMLDLEEKANITPEDTAAGINAKLNLIDNAGNLMMKWGDMADDYVAKHGKLDPGFDKTLRAEIAKARIPDVVPKSDTTTAPPSSPERSAIEEEMRKRGLLKATAPVSE